jgi:DNA-binding PadR family transcriptional regulator
MDVEYEILAVLWESSQTRNALMRSLRARLGGLEVDPEAVYPALQMLADGDFVAGSASGEGVLYTLTQQGSELLATRAAAHEEDADPLCGDRESPIARAAHLVRGAAAIALQLAWRKFAR